MALQDHKEGTNRQAAWIWAVTLLALAVGCASGPKESPHAARMRLFRQYYHDLTPPQRSDYRAGKFESAEAAERKLKQYVRLNQSREKRLGQKQLKSAEIERVWERAEKFISEAQDFADKHAGLRARNPGLAAQKAAEMRSRCQELAEALKRTRSQIRHGFYEPAERQTRLERSSYYQSRLDAVRKLLSQSK